MSTTQQTSTHTRTEDGVSRRDFLRVGGLAAAVLTLGDLTGPSVARGQEPDANQPDGDQPNGNAPADQPQRQPEQQPGQPVEADGAQPAAVTENSTDTIDQFRAEAEQFVGRFNESPIGQFAANNGDVLAGIGTALTASVVALKGWYNWILRRSHERLVYSRTDLIPNEGESSGAAISMAVRTMDEDSAGRICVSKTAAKVLVKRARQTPKVSAFLKFKRNWFWNRHKSSEGHRLLKTALNSLAKGYKKGQTLWDAHQPVVPVEYVIGFTCEKGANIQEQMVRPLVSTPDELRWVLNELKTSVLSETQYAAIMDSGKTTYDIMRNFRRALRSPRWYNWNSFDLGRWIRRGPDPYAEVGRKFNDFTKQRFGFEFSYHTERAEAVAEMAIGYVVYQQKKAEAREQTEQTEQNGRQKDHFNDCLVWLRVFVEPSDITADNVIIKPRLPDNEPPTASGAALTSESGQRRTTA